MEQMTLAVRLRERARFDNFVIGPNKMALSSVAAAAAGPGRIVVLTGPSACGKTHLLLASVHAAREAGRRAAYFALRELASLGAAGMSGHGAADLVCCDDVDVVAADVGFCRALFALWRDREERGASLIFAARDLPALSDWALADTGSRLRGVAEHTTLLALGEPDQRVVLTQRAHSIGLELPEETLQYLWRRLPRDLGTQCALLDELDQAALTAQRRLTVPFVREVLARR